MPRYSLPPGKIIKGYVVQISPTPEQAEIFSRASGARRFAYNWAVSEIKKAFDVGGETGQYDKEVWSAWSLQKRWNQVKAEVAPWWAQNPKDAYRSGIGDAVTALTYWQASRSGKRPGPRMRFPKFKKKARDPVRCTFSGGVPVRLEGPRVVVLPKAGAVRTAENMRPIWRHIRRGSGRILNVTVREKAGRWSASLRLEIDSRYREETAPSVVGVDLGIGDNLLIVMRPDGTVAEKVPNPKALRSALDGIRKAQRSMDRKVEGSRRWQRDRGRLGRIYGRTSSIRKDALHKATTNLAKTHSVVVIEDIAVAGHIRGWRKHRKAWKDAAAGEFRSQMTYKAAWYDCDLYIADRFYPSSKTCSACGTVNAALSMNDRRWDCPSCGAHHDRDENAGVNLARLPAGWAEAQSDCKTGLARRVAVKRVNHLGKVAA